MNLTRIFKICLTGTFLLISTQAHALLIQAPAPENDFNYNITSTSQLLTDIEVIMGTGFDGLYKKDRGGREVGAIFHVGAYRRVRTHGTTSIPEPSQMLLFGTCLIGLAGSRLRRKKKQ